MLKILLLEDNKNDVELLRVNLLKQIDEFTIINVDNEKDFISNLHNSSNDIIIADYNLPSYSGLEALAYRNKHYPTLPFIILTGSMNEQIAVSCMKAGADDYVLKEHIKRIGAAIETAVHIKKLEKQQLEAEHNLIYEKELYKNLFVLSPVGLIIEDSEGVIIDVNEAVLKTTGYSRNELIGKHISIFEPDHDLQKAKENIDKINNGETLSLEVISIGKNGSRHYTELTETKITFPGGRTGILSINNDITPRKKIEEDLLKSNQSLAMAQEIGNIGSWDNDLINNEIYWSDQTFRQFGLDPSKDKPSDKLFKQNIHPDDLEKVELAIEKTFKSLEPYDIKVKMRRSDGTVWFMHAHGRIITNDKGKPIRFIGIQQDITDIVKNTKELIRAKESAEESNRLKSEFLANLSHEIRTPMNGIIGFASLLEQEELRQEERKNFSQIIINSSKQLLRIIDDLIEISKLQTRQVKTYVKELNIGDLLIELFTIFELKGKSSGISFYVNNALKPNEQIIITDGSKVKKVLENLLENAFKFTKEGMIELGVEKREKELVFYVKDSGIGIEKNKQELIFERFSQEEKEISRKSGGLGLGLSIAKENVNLLNGKIWVESVKGEGSAFYFALPLEKNDENKTDSTERTDDIINDTEKQVVVVAEDEEVNFQYISLLLKKYSKPLTVLHAKNGKEAVDFCKSETKIALILMDVKMPVMNGLEATKIIKKMFSDLPVVAQTAYTRPEDRERAIEAGVDEFISKPFQKKAFYALLDRFLDEK